MRSDETTVDGYLASLAEDRREALSAVLGVVRANLPDGYVEGFAHGMIAWSVPLAAYPDTYNGEPLMYAALASQKRHMALYLMGVYGSDDLRERFVAEYRASGKRLDMGKSCVRFARLDDLPLDVVGRAVAAVPCDAYVAMAKAAVGEVREELTAGSGADPARAAGDRQTPVSAMTRPDLAAASSAAWSFSVWSAYASAKSANASSSSSSSPTYAAIAAGSPERAWPAGEGPATELAPAHQVVVRHGVDDGAPLLVLELPDVEVAAVARPSPSRGSTSLAAWSRRWPATTRSPWFA